MEVEDNIIEKLKFFAQYYDQRVAVVNFSNSLMYVGTHSTIGSDILYLELTSLSDISDEDAIEVANIIHAWISNNYESASYDIPGFVEYLKEVFIDGFGSIGISGISNYIKAYQYLQSKGYLLPYGDLSVKELINRGWVKLKTKTDEGIR